MCCIGRSSTVFEALLAQSEAWGTLSARAGVVSLLKARMKRSVVVVVVVVW